MEHKRRIDGRRLLFYRPYPKQEEFHAAGSSRRERLFMAGNQLGKTLAGGFEAAIHATGLYPTWWTGRRFDGPTVGWAAGVTGETVRESVQRVLMGRHTDVGTGAIPQAKIVDYTASRGVADLMDTIEVRHVSGGTSLITLKSYEKSREKWQAETLDWVWFDEEPDAKIYTEGVTRTNATKGLVWLTFTPLKGMSDVVKRFLLEPSADRHVTTMTIDDAEHYSAEERARIIASYDAHEREARTKGIPMLSRREAVYAIEGGAWYMRKLRGGWKNRAIADSHDLALASYNAGVGNILKAQKHCSNARLWTQIAPCLPRITGRGNAHETTSYVANIHRWFRVIETGK